jgi:hypothetical protein
MTVLVMSVVCLTDLQGNNAMLRMCPTPRSDMVSLQGAVPQAAARGTWTHLQIELYINRVTQGENSDEFRMPLGRIPSAQPEAFDCAVEERASASSASDLMQHSATGGQRRPMSRPP